MLIGADGLHSVVRDVVGARDAEPTGWCSWQGLVTLPDLSDPADEHVAAIIIGEQGNAGLWPAGGTLAAAQLSAALTRWCGERAKDQCAIG